MNRKCVLHIHFFSSLLARFPFRHRLDYSQCFCIKIRIYTFRYNGFFNVTFFGNNKLNDNSTLYTVFLSNDRVLEVLAHPLHAFSHTTREFRHFFYHLEDCLFGYYCLFFHFNLSKLYFRFSLIGRFRILSTCNHADCCNGK